MLGLTIRGRRVGAGLTLRRCAELMGLTMTDLSAVEQGQRPFTDQEFSDFNRVANLTGVSFGRVARALEAKAKETP